MKSQNKNLEKSSMPSKIEFSLFAPHNPDISLIGSWNDWKPKPMELGKDGYWRVSEELQDGDYLYRFQCRSKSYFCMDEMIEIFDPYSLHVTNEDPTSSHLKVRDGNKSHLNYVWKHDSIPLPINQDMLIYEMHIGDFNPRGPSGAGDEKGTFETAIQKLDYVKELGINTVELLPVKEFRGDGWGYSLQSLFAVENTYGGPEELCRFVDECHARGIRVIIDGVYNHADSESPLAKLNYEYWFYRENPDPQEMQWGPKFNFLHFDEDHKTFPARKYAIESINHWVRDYHIDGIRFDATRAIAFFDVMKEFTDACFNVLGQIKPFITIAEHVGEDPDISGYPHRGPMVAAWHQSFAKQLQSLATEIPLHGQEPYNLEAIINHIDPKKNNYNSGQNYVNYLGSHDEDRILRLLAEEGGKFDNDAFRRVKLATAIMLTIPGIPMIWMGQEFGAANPKSLGPQPLDWNLLNNKNNSDLSEYTRELISLRSKVACLRNDSMEVIYTNSEMSVMGYKRWDQAGGEVVVLVNLSDEDRSGIELLPPSISIGKWSTFSSNDKPFEISESGFVFTLKRSEVKILIKH